MGRPSRQQKSNDEEDSTISASPALETDGTATERVAETPGLAPAMQRNPGCTGGSCGPDSDGPSTREEYEEYYGIDIDRAGQIERLQRLETSNSVEQVRAWARAGVPIAAMGKPSKMASARASTQAGAEDEEAPTTVQRRAASKHSSGDSGAIPDSLRQVLDSTGDSLAPSVRQSMEAALGGDFGDVEVHTGPKAMQAADAIDAEAATIGNHVVMNRRELDLSRLSDEHLMAHELTHVRQQTSETRLSSPGSQNSPGRQQSPSGGLPSPASAESAGRQTGDAVSQDFSEDVASLQIDPDPQLEREADRTARRVMAGRQPPAPTSDAGLSVQRANGQHIYEFGRFRQSRNDYDFKTIQFAKILERHAEQNKQQPARNRNLGEKNNFTAQKEINMRKYKVIMRNLLKEMAEKLEIESGNIDLAETHIRDLKAANELLREDRLEAVEQKRMEVQKEQQDQLNQIKAIDSIYDGDTNIGLVGARHRASNRLRDLDQKDRRDGGLFDLYWGFAEHINNKRRFHSMRDQYQLAVDREGGGGPKSTKYAAWSTLSGVTTTGMQVVMSLAQVATSMIIMDTNEIRRKNGDDLLTSPEEAAMRWLIPFALALVGGLLANASLPALINMFDGSLFTHTINFTLPVGVLGAIIFNALSWEFDWPPWIAPAATLGLQAVAGVVIHLFLTDLGRRAESDATSIAYNSYRAVDNYWNRAAGFRQAPHDPGTLGDLIDKPAASIETMNLPDVVTNENFKLVDFSLPPV